MNPTSTFSTFSKWVDRHETIVVIVLTILFATFVLPALLILGLLFQLNFQIAVISAKMFGRGQLVKPLNPISAVLANIDNIYTDPDCTIVNAVILEGVPDMQKIKDTIKVQILERVDPKTGKLMYPELFQNISYWMSYPFWRKLSPEKNNPEWFLKECVRYYRDDGELESNFKVLQNLIKQMYFSPFSKGKPLIDVTILPNYIPHPEKNAGLSPDGKYFCLILRNHHALADGFALLRILQKMCTTAAPEQFEYIQTHDYTTQGKLSQSRSFFINFFENLKLLPKMLYELVQSMVFHTFHSSPGCIWPNKPIRPVTKSMSDIGNNSRRFHNFITASGKPFNMAEINEIKEIHGVSGTAVLFSAMIGAVKSTMLNSGDVIPTYIGVDLTLPLPEHNGLLDNQFALGSMGIELREENPIKRLHNMNISIQNLKKSTLPVSNVLVVSTMLGRMPRWLFRLIIPNLARGTEGVFSSNVAGPKKMFDLAEYPIRDIFMGMGLNSEKMILLLGMISMGGKARLTVVGDTAVIASDEQAELLTENFFRELGNLRQGNGNDIR